MKKTRSSLVTNSAKYWTQNYAKNQARNRIENYTKIELKIGLKIETTIRLEIAIKIQLKFRQKNHAEIELKKLIGLIRAEIFLVRTGIKIDLKIETKSWGDKNRSNHLPKNRAT